MKINAYNRLRNPLTANLQEDKDAVYLLDHMARRFKGTVKFLDDEEATIRGNKNARFDLAYDSRRGVYLVEIYFKVDDGLFVEALGKGSTLDAALADLTRKVDARLSEYEDRAASLRKEAESIERGLRTAKSALSF